jgi:peptidoglycan hydrolase-like protein with peptidoglycan-binding domain
LAIDLLKKPVAALLVITMLACAAHYTAMAGPALIADVVKKGDTNDNVILLQLRLRDLGFYNYKITGFFGDFTGDALKDFQETNGIKADGVAGEKTLGTLYDNTAKRKPIAPLASITTPVKIKKMEFGQYIDWSVVNKMWSKKMRCKVVDLDTGITYYMIRVNESYSVGHADVAPATKSDTNKLKQTFGGELNAYRRALVVIIGGQKFAASIYAQPHGSTGVPGNGLNKEDGTLQQVCIHFKNSRNNVHDMIDPAHQYQVKRAANIKQSGTAPGLVYPGD